MGDKYGFDLPNRYELFYDDPGDPHDVLTLANRFQKIKLQDNVGNKTNSPGVCEKEEKMRSPEVKGQCKTTSKPPHVVRVKVEESQATASENIPSDSTCEEGEWTVSRKKKVQRKSAAKQQGAKLQKPTDFDERKRRELDRPKNGSGLQRPTKQVSFEGQSYKPPLLVRAKAKTSGSAAAADVKPTKSVSGEVRVEKTRACATDMTSIKKPGRGEPQKEKNKRSDAEIDEPPKDKMKGCGVDVKGDAEVKSNITLDEWKQLEGHGRPTPAYNFRKPGEGENKEQWENMHALKKKQGNYHDDGGEVVGGTKKKQKKKCLDTSSRSKKASNIFPIQSSSEQQTTCDVQPRAATPKVDDFTEFPSLNFES